MEEPRDHSCEVPDSEELREHSLRLPSDVQIILPWERYHRLQSGGSPLLSSELPLLQEQDRVRGLPDGWEDEPEQLETEAMEAVRATPQYVRPKPKWFCAKTKSDKTESDKGKKRQRAKPTTQSSASMALPAAVPWVPIGSSQRETPKEARQQLPIGSSQPVAFR